jgi:mRNA-degrading endonuclease HigB of HigAB toxin-antitoxin module
MKLLGRNRLQALYGLDDQTDKWLRSWVSEISHATWKHPKDVLLQFPQAKSVANGTFYFRVGRHSQYVEVSMMFPLAVAIVTDLKREN